METLPDAALAAALCLAWNALGDRPPLAADRALRRLARAHAQAAAHALAQPDPPAALRQQEQAAARTVLAAADLLPPRLALHPRLAPLRQRLADVLRR